VAAGRIGEEAILGVTDEFVLHCPMPAISITGFLSPFISRHLFSLTMSTSIPGKIPKLSDDELTLHHYTAVVRKYLEVYWVSAAEKHESLNVALKDTLISGLVFFHSCDLPLEAKLMLLRKKQWIYLRSPH
jgi:hypothetical protein